MKKFLTLLVTGLCSISVLALQACSTYSVSSSKLEAIKAQASETVDLAGWTKAMTSTDIYNCKAVKVTSSKSTYVSGGETTVTTVGQTETAFVDLSCWKGYISGYSGYVSGTIYYAIDMNEASYIQSGEEAEGLEIKTETYFVVGEDKYVSYTKIGDDSYQLAREVEEDGYTVQDIDCADMFIQVEYANSNYSGGEYTDFVYDEESGSYVYESKEGNYTYVYELKFSNGNVVYYKEYYYYYNRQSSYTRETEVVAEVYYIYGDVSVEAPSDLQNKLDAIME